MSIIDSRVSDLIQAIMDRMYDGHPNWGNLADGNAYHWSTETGRVALVGPVGPYGWGYGYCDPSNYHKLIGDWHGTTGHLEDAIACAEIMAARRA